MKPNNPIAQQPNSPIVFFGSSKFVLPILEALRKNFNLKLVVTTENPIVNLASKGEAFRSYPVINYCAKNEIPYLSLRQFNNSAIQQLRKVHASVGVLADFGIIIPQQVFDLLPKGIINIHPSLLPKYRGPTPVQTAILNGDKISGVTIIKLDEEIDHGPILTQTQEPILEHDTSESLYERLFQVGAGSIVRIIELYLKGKIKPQPQDHSNATFTEHLTRENGFIDIKNPPSSEKLHNMIRAYFPWPGVWSRWKMENGKWKILKFLPEKKIQVEGKKPMSYKDFLNGYPNAKGVILPILK